MVFGLDAILTWLLKAALTALGAAVDMVAGSLLTTPDVTGLPQVQALTGRSVWVVDTVFVVVFVAAGGLAMVSGGDEQARYTARELLPRLVVGFVAAHFCPPLCSGAIEVANALVAAVTDGDPHQASVGGALEAMSGHATAAATKPASALLALVLIVVIVVLVVATGLSLIGRLVVLLVLTVAAPLALACHALPATDPVARLWWRAMAGCLAVPVLQAFTLQAGQWMLTDPRHILPSTPLPGDQSGAINLLVVIVMLGLTVRIPRLIGRYVTASRPGGMVGQILRVVFVQQTLRGLGLRGHRSRGGHGRGTGPGPGGRADGRRRGTASTYWGTSHRSQNRGGSSNPGRRNSTTGRGPHGGYGRPSTATRTPGQNRNQGQNRGQGQHRGRGGGRS